MVLMSVSQSQVLAGIRSCLFDLFTSQIADHGRQPDFNFEDTLNLSADTPKAPSVESEEPRNPQPEVIIDARRRLAPKVATESVDYVLSDTEEPELPPNRSLKYQSPHRDMSDIPEDDPSSPDIFPTIEKMASSQMAAKRERVTPTKSLSKKDAKTKRTTTELDDDIFEDDQTTPKASQKQRSISGSRAYKGKMSDKAASQPRPSQSRSKFEPSQATQVVDLTQTSSDIEVESEAEKDRGPFKKYYNDDDDDSFEEEDKSGWRRKKDTSGGEVEKRRHTGVGLRHSSQSALNTQGRRKTSAR